MRSTSWIIVPSATSLWRRPCGSIAGDCTPRGRAHICLVHCKGCGTLGVFGERLGRLLLKLAVEHSMTNHLLGGDMDMARDEYSKMRGSSVREVSATHGTISFKDVLLFYKED